MPLTFPSIMRFVNRYRSCVQRGTVSFPALAHRSPDGACRCKPIFRLPRAWRSSLFLRRAESDGAAYLLGAVHGGIRRLDERVRVLAVRRIDRDSDADPDADALAPAAEAERHGQRDNDFPGDGFRLPAPGDVGQDHGEFIAP